MARYGIGDVQGCRAELEQLLAALRFSADRDELWFVGDLVNRGPDSLGVLRLVRSLDANATVVLGNHDLHLLAIAFGETRRTKPGDTLDSVLAAPDRAALLEWLLMRPLAHMPVGSRDLLVHAGIVPQWSIDVTVRLAHEVERALRRDPKTLFGAMYGNQPDCWSDALEGSERMRFIINVLTRLRFCAPDGRVNLKLKGAPNEVAAPFAPWYSYRDSTLDATRIVFGHWSTLGLVRRPELLGLDTGCVWGGALTAVDLDDPARPPWQIACNGYQEPGAADG